MCIAVLPQLFSLYFCLQPASMFMMLYTPLFSGIIPGPSEPKGSEMNRILSPLVEELLRLDSGLELAGLKCRARLLYVCADLPAARKVLGLNSVSANRGKNTC